MKYVKITDREKRKKYLTHLGAEKSGRNCGLFGILYTDELTIYILNTPGPHWSACMVTDYNNHRYCLWGAQVDSPYVWKIYKVDSASADSDEIRKMIQLVLDSARYIRVYDGAELEMISKSYDKLIIQDITETIDGVHLY
jgi:hypothetical protein